MKPFALIIMLISTLFLQACVHKIVTVPAKVAYKTTKGVVKGTVAVGKAIIPGGDDDEGDDKGKKKK
ncbi:NF038104 family lipoprotein [Psychrobacter pygoscelis]|uniref:NF038104 family lipoprotein n=1 Tax=Psychrobacter pygoscelis TaxID=2488563 RepID=UPI0010402699|nr:NF038104 family lipoprotein [Psychrobacter pygoscelis]